MYTRWTLYSNIFISYFGLIHGAPWWVVLACHVIIDDTFLVWARFFLRHTLSCTKHQLLASEFKLYVYNISWWCLLWTYIPKEFGMQDDHHVMLSCTIYQCHAWMVIYFFPFLISIYSCIIYMYNKFFLIILRIQYFVNGCFFLSSKWRKVSSDYLSIGEDMCT